MNKLLISIVDLPFLFWGMFIPSLPSEIKSFNTVQRLWLVVSVVAFYASIGVLLADIYWNFIFESPNYGWTNPYTKNDMILTLWIVLSFFFPIVLYYAASLLSALFGFIFEKQLKESKKNNER